MTTNIPVGNSGGFIGGGQIGYNYQSGRFVAGIETDIQGLSGKGSGTITTVTPIIGFLGTQTTTLTATHSVDWLGTLRGRVGFTATPNLLLYGTGGLAYGGVHSNTTIAQVDTGPSATGVNGPYGSFASGDQTRVGWALGAGGEWAFAGNWSAKLEYLHYDLGRVSYTGTMSNLSVAPLPVGNLLYTVNSTSTTRFSGDIVRVGLNYKFNWMPAPLVAKY